MGPKRAALTSLEPLSASDPPEAHDLVNGFRELALLLIQADHIPVEYLNQLATPFDPEPWRTAGFDECIIKIAANLPCLREFNIIPDIQGCNYRYSLEIRDFRKPLNFPDDSTLPETALPLTAARWDVLNYFYDAKTSK
jgi:hypothetical protein